ncbi:MAG TPA: hypothetical protein VNJ01_01285 [Bacteriovoracaceae bacterium]|nr:hypothetical protein [Bacteriovoracaceae bacterium]
MNVIKLLVIIFAIYFIRRFFQLYSAMKRVQEEARLREQAAADVNQRVSKKKQDSDVIEADYKVVD